VLRSAKVKHMRGRKLRSDVNWQGALKKKRAVNGRKTRHWWNSLHLQPTASLLCFFFIGRGTSGYEKLF
jgi:hypothetical protein